MTYTEDLKEILERADKWHLVGNYGWGLYKVDVPRLVKFIDALLDVVQGYDVDGNIIDFQKLWDESKEGAK